MHIILKYDEIQSTLNQLDCHISAAETHGIACGMLATNIAIKNSLWIDELIVEEQFSNTQINKLNALFEQTLQALNDSNLNFSLLLPDDEVDLAKRLSAAQEWGQGLLYGAALAGLKEFTKLPEDSREFLQDVAKIASSGAFDLEEGEEAELSYAEIVEYLRVGTLLLSEELQPSKLDTAVH